MDRKREYRRVTRALTILNLGIGLEWWGRLFSHCLLLSGAEALAAGRGLMVISGRLLTASALVLFGLGLARACATRPLVLPWIATATLVIDLPLTLSVHWISSVELPCVPLAYALVSLQIQVVVRELAAASRSRPWALRIAWLALLLLIVNAVAQLIPASTAVTNVGGWLFDLRSVTNFAALATFLSAVLSTRDLVHSASN